MVFHAWGCTLNGREGNKEDMKKLKKDGSFFFLHETVKMSISQAAPQFRIVPLKLHFLNQCKLESTIIITLFGILFSFFDLTN